ncbi:MAG: hypothetical protein LLF93_00020 [Bacteroidales bacterium]|nr:hypothetical protein [Bacteroidales bacterium]
MSPIEIDPDNIDEFEDEISEISLDQLGFSAQEQLYETALQIIRDIIESAECDQKTGEIILWGRWGQSENIEEERFQSVEQIKYFLASFGWT